MRPMREERTHLIYRLRVFDAKSGKLLGHMTDITPEGMMLIGEKAVKPKKEFSLRMDLPRNVMEDRHLTFAAVSKWCRKDASGDYYSMGFQIQSISPEGLAVVRTLIRDFFREELEGDSVTDLNPVL
ncbi:MAG: PilZ domain-containing protein [Spirochaetia bacterium]